MVLPLLPLMGLLGLGATAGAKPFYDQWVTGREGRRADDALAGAGPSVGEQQRALLRAGLLSAENFAGLGQDENQFGRSLAQNQSQFGAGQAQQESQFARSLGLDTERFAWDRAQNGLAQLSGLPVQFFTGGQMVGDDGLPIPDGAMGDGSVMLGGVNLNTALDALSNMESGGSYGSVNDSSGALGKYQVMPANVGPWSEQVLGRALTPEEFLADPAAQERIVSEIFGGYLQEGGLLNALSRWHSGRPLEAAAAAGAHDGNMATTDYVDTIARSYMTLEDQRMGERARAADPIFQQAQVRGQRWLDMDAPGRASILSMENGSSFIDDFADYIDQTTAAGRTFDDQSSAEWATRYQLTILPALKTMMDAGALDDSERKWFEEIMGNPTGWGNLGDETARLRAIQQSIDARLNIQKQALGLSDYRAPSAGGNLVQGRP